jgi:hypothetical protein
LAREIRLSNRTISFERFAETMRAYSLLLSLLVVTGCATITRSRVGPQVLGSYPYAADASIPELDASSPIKRRLIRIVAGSLRKATRRRRLHDDMDHRMRLGDALSTMVPGQAPQVR